MEYKEIEGDLLKLAKKGEFDLIAHGCNCQRIMGAGIAFQIAKAFPDASYVDTIDPREGISRLGDFTIGIELADKNSNRFYFEIVNLYTQFLPGKNLDFLALKLGLRKINMKYPKKHIGLPLIGCGIAGGNWKIVKKIIQTTLVDMKVTVVKFKQ